MYHLTCVSLGCPRSGILQHKRGTPFLAHQKQAEPSVFDIWCCLLLEKKKKKKKRLQFINDHALPLWRQKKRYQSTSIANPSITFAVRARVDAAGILSVRLETPRSKGGLHPGGQMPVRLKPRPPPRSKLGVYDSDLQQVGLAWMSPSHLERERRREDAGVVMVSTLQEYPNVLRPGTLRSRCTLPCDAL